ncbi:MAG: class I SAM-dependent methyltransferase [Candidatus Rokubacteria bacterium]|nr:class I SAM-dependent methyltransferase [Candidatus Rokubacteria bacterium]
MRCLICGSGSLEERYTAVRDHFGVVPGEFRFLGCNACGSLSLDPVPAAESIATLYPREYTFRAADTSEPAIRRLLRAIEWRLFYRPQYHGRLRTIRRLTGLGAGRALEVGSGSGLFLRLLVEAGFEGRGLDISREDVAYARERLGLAVTEGDLATAASLDARYDLVLMFYVLEHVPDPVELVRSACALLAPGGWLVAAVPVIDSLQSRLFGARWSQVTEAPRHITLPSRAGLVRMLAAAGFTDVRWGAMPLLDNAGVIVMSLLPGAATPQAYGRGATLAPLVRRFAAGLLLPPALLAAFAERLPLGPGPGMTMVCARKRPSP